MRPVQTPDAPGRRPGGVINVLLALAGALSLAATLWMLWSLHERDRPLQTPASPHGILDLQVAGDLDRAREIISAWAVAGALERARENLAEDEVLLVLYAAFFALTGILVVRLLDPKGSRGRWAIGGIIALAAGAALLDHLENIQIGYLLDRDTGAWSLAREGAAARRTLLLAQWKYSCILALLAGIATGGAAAFRRLVLFPPGKEATAAGSGGAAANGDFERLARTEAPDPGRVGRGPSDDPWIDVSNTDRVGLALSGGGIRSATFNLGLLQGLQRHDLLRHLDYLSTVSGGGYIGGWWTAWRARQGGSALRGAFPASADGQEAQEVRHLREFGNFLVPRWGFLESEMWNAIVAVLGGMLPALAAALAFMALALLGWLVLAFHAVWRSLLIPPALVVGLTAVFFLVGERLWIGLRKAEPDQVTAAAYRWFSVISLAAVAGLWFGWRWLLMNTSLFVPGGAEWPVWCEGRWIALDGAGPLESWWHGMGATRGLHGIHFYPRVLDPAIVWLATSLLLFAMRLLGSSIRTSEWRRSFVSGIDRALARLLSLASAWALLALIWVAGSNLDKIDYASLIAGGGAAGSAGLFGWLRGWIGSKATAKGRSGLMAIVKPLVPVVLAYVAVALAAIFVAGLMVQGLRDSWWSWYWGAMALVALQGCMLFIDLTEVGLHAFYRDRIIRAYLGASNPDATAEAAREKGGRLAAAFNRQTETRKRDDLPLREAPGGPTHLICCAANDLGGDHLANLSRGSRSAVLSRHGIAIADYWAAEPHLMMGPALTASAAAINSNMGSISMRLGPPIAFLTSALNLRLGLWLRHPVCPTRTPPLLPGLLFIREMLGQTMSGTDTKGRPVSQDLHLSDGAHFENLALYELVRRHCRYIIVSDCGEDPDVAFDDFGNAARRIREDFGVEIEIDLSPLKPDESGISRQHMAVGTVLYHRPHDSGLLLYFKPTLTGDEPRDVIQYHERNAGFPHESTGDQFYDESQWESYRRLGQHAAESSLRFVERMPGGGRALVAADFFIGARQEWYPAPADLESSVLELSERYAALESELRAEAPQSLAREIFPEIDALYQPSHAPIDEWEELRSRIHLLMKMMQLMEDVWMACHLDTHYNHPLNLGWLNLFHRWAWTPSFRMWWPFLAPMFGSGFRRFAAEQFDLREGGPDMPAGTLQALRGRAPEGLATEWWRRMGGRPPDPDDTVFTYTLTFTSPRGERTDVQVALAVVSVEEGVAAWTGQNLFVPASLWGTGIGSKFLRAIAKHLREARPDVATCRVTLGSRLQPERTDRGSLQEMVDQIEFYKKAGFVFVDAEGERYLRLDLRGR